MESKAPGGIALFLAISLIGPSPALAIEEPPYEILEDCGEFEIRRYPASVGAVTRVDGDFDAAGSRGFRTLAGYIFGGNQNEEQIAMTAPVAQSSARDSEAGPWQVLFYMPGGRSVENLPRPDEEDVEVRRIEAKTVAALAFSGSWSEVRFREQEALLRASLGERSIPARGPSTWARYDPPWTLWFLRRNEIWVELPGELGPGCADPDEADSAA